MNRLTFFKRLFNVAAVAAIAPKAEASQGLSITKDFKKQTPKDRIELTPAQVDAFIEKYGLNKKKFTLRSSDLSLNLKRAKNNFNLRRP